MKAALLPMLCMALTPAWAQAADFQSIKVRLATLRESPDFLSSKVGQLKYGTKADLLESSGAWAKVQHENTIGWLPNSALSEKNVTFTLKEESDEKKKSSFGFANPFNKRAEVNSSEMAMAGKAWDNDLPLEGGASYAHVDAMEAIDTPIEDVIRYLKSLKSELK